MTNLSSIIFIASCFSQLLAQTTLSQQQLLARTSDFMFAAEQTPITINYIVEIQKFSSIQIDQLKNAIQSITDANNFELAVTDLDGKQVDMPIKTLHLKLRFFTKYFTDTLKAYNSYLDSHKDVKNDFNFGTFACNISQDFSHRDIPSYLLDVMSGYRENAIEINDTAMVDQDSKPHKKLKTSIIIILEELRSVSKEFDDLFELYYALLNNQIPLPFYTHLKNVNQCDLDGQTVISDISCQLQDQQIRCKLLALQLKDIRSYESYFFVPIYGHSLDIGNLVWINDRAHNLVCHSKNGDIHHDCSFEHIEPTCVAAISIDDPSIEDILESCPFKKLSSPDNVYELEDLYILTGRYAESAWGMLTSGGSEAPETRVLGLRVDRAIKLPGSPPVWLRQKGITNETSTVYLTDREIEHLQAIIDSDPFQDVIQHMAFYPAVSGTAVLIVFVGIIVLLVAYFRGKLTKTKLTNKYLPFIPWNKRTAPVRPRRQRDPTSRSAKNNVELENLRK